uniref:Synaptobrevin-like protein n=1 Tax=Strombidium rassoulzadegani TaxID=1082188 RepID=A0A7S3CQ28_9SPIT|mmetsp:Transcript_3338/g.5561  ORF Transcript_3338/g.5561 Transcript_3338/m.5561 type:complete len:173 (+) Transcript_3338:142-660(+)
MAKEHINFNSRLISGRVEPGNKTTTSLDQNIGQCHCWTTADGISATAITDNEYPERAAYLLLNNLILDFRDYFAADPSVYENAVCDLSGKLPYPNIKDFLQKWQNPQEADKLLKAEKELFEVKEIMHQNLNDVLKRGENLEQLMAKSKDLSAVSVDFYKKAKKQNQKCCSIS